MSARALLADLTQDPQSSSFDRARFERAFQHVISSHADLPAAPTYEPLRQAVRRLLETRPRHELLDLATMQVLLTVVAMEQRAHEEAS